jgi:phosphoribosylanthranilate isomerase
VVKVCGLTRLEDVLSACELGAWAMGFVFAPSPRRLTPAAARGLIGSAAAALATRGRGPGLPLTVGVFGDTTAQEIAAVVEEIDLDGVQLHGLAGPGGLAVRAALAGRSRPLLVIQAVPVNTETTAVGALVEAVAAARAQADIVLFDTKAAGRFGGAGKTFPWKYAREIGEGAPFLVAGGIGPENVQAALQESGAWGVDVSSAIERSHGVKDLARMMKLFENVGAVTGVRAWADERQEGSDQ